MGLSVREPSRALYLLSRHVSRHWGATVGVLLGIGVVGGFVCYALGDRWNSVSIFETCYGVVLTIGIFTWTLSGYAPQRADRKRRGAEQFAKAIQKSVQGGGTLGPGRLDVYLPVLSKFLDVPEKEVEGGAAHVGCSRLREARSARSSCDHSAALVHSSARPRRVARDGLGRSAQCQA